MINLCPLVIEMECSSSGVRKENGEELCLKISVVWGERGVVHQKRDYLLLVVDEKYCQLHKEPPASDDNIYAKDKLDNTESGELIVKH